MAISNAVKTKRDGTITIFDSGAANTITVDYEGEGNFTFDNGSNLAERVVLMDRGSIVGLRQGNDTVGSISFSIDMREFKNTTIETLIDALNHSGSCSGWVSTGGASFEQYLLDCTLTIDGMSQGDTANPTATFDKVLFSWDFSEGSPNVINITGEVYGGIAYAGIIV